MTYTSPTPDTLIAFACAGSAIRAAVLVEFERQHPEEYRNLAAAMAAGNPVSVSHVTAPGVNDIRIECLDSAGGRKLIANIPGDVLPIDGAAH